MRDITERKTTEEALRRSNEYLRRFSYVVSHDLQEPLRQVTVFSQMLARKYAQDPGAKDYSDHVIDGTGRMQNAIKYRHPERPPRIRIRGTF